MRRIFNKYWPLLTIVFVWLLFAYPFFLKGKVPYPSTYQVTFFAPWSAYEKFWGPVKNNAMPDIIDQIYPWKHYTMEVFRNGIIPFWNPYSFSGNPHLANFQTAVFSPFNLLYFIFPFLISWSLIVLLQPLVAGIGTYLFMKELKVSSYGQLISSITFMFCGFIVVWMAYGTLSMAIAFLPFVLYGIEKNFNKSSIFSFLIIVIGVVFSFFSGHFQTSLYLLLFSLFYFLYKSVTSKKVKTSLLVFGAISVGVGVALIQIIPSIFFYINSVRSEIFISGGGIPIQYLTTIFAPDFYGNPVTRNDWFGYYAEWASFIGILPLFLAILAIVAKRSRLSLFFFLIGSAFLVLAMESQLLSLLSHLKIPVLSTSTPSRIIVLFSFSFAVLAGIGIDQLKQLLEQKKTRVIIAPILAVGGVLVLTWIILLFFAKIPVYKVALAMKNLLLPSFLFFTVVVSVGINVLRKNSKVVKMILFILIILSAFDSLRYASKWMPFDPKNLVFPDVPVITAMKKNIGYGRVFGNLGTQVDTYYRLASIEGYDPLYIQRYGEFIRTANTGNFLQAERSVVHLDRRGKYTMRVLDLLGVNLIFHPNADTNQGWAFPVWEDAKRFRQIYEDNKHHLFVNSLALPRAMLFYNYEIIRNSKSVLKRFYTEDFDYRRTLLLEENPYLPVFNANEQKGDAEITRYEPNKIIIQTKTNVPALLFLSDTYYPKWKVTVNGKKEKIYRADYAFRAVRVPAGKSTVTFTYNEFF